MSLANSRNIVAGEGFRLSLLEVQLKTKENLRTNLCSRREVYLEPFMEQNIRYNLVYSKGGDPKKPFLECNMLCLLSPRGQGLNKW